ncbi:MAG: hypothetical protein CSB47_10045 [Proteobacteria bacterium]|nr:MAG: hypothetical protein CSB47_10045 [Pseudomonadota bacterium]
MGYLILQIWVFLLVAALIGFVAGWLLRGGGRHQLNKLNQEWSQRVANLEAERDECSQKIEELNAASVRQGDMYLKLSDERDILSKRLLDSERSIEQENLELHDYKQALKQRDVEIGQLQSQLKETTVQLTDTQDALNAIQASADGEATTPQHGAILSDRYSQKLKDAESTLQEREQQIATLQQELSGSVAALEDTKQSLAAELELEREKASNATAQLEETKRQLGEYEEQLTASEKTLGEVSGELKQKQEFFDVARRELESKLHQGDGHIAELNSTVKAQETHLQQLKAELEVRERSLSELSEKEIAQQQMLSRYEQQLQETQKALTESGRRQQQLEQELHASQLKVSVLEEQSSMPQQPRDYSGVSSGIFAGGTTGTAVVGDADRQTSGWSKLSEMARDGFEKVKEKVEDTTSEVVTVTAKASPNDENYRIEVIRSIGNDNRRHLHDMGITTTLNLLDRCSDEDGIKLISKALGRESWVVSSWVSIADILRVKGIDGPMAEVLELSGVYSAKALANANPERLIQLIDSVNKRVEKVSRVPDIATVAGWIRHAETM